MFSECHELFGDAQHGREAADLAVQTMRRARKTAITLAFDTQSSRADAIPPKIVELVKLNACFAVKSWRSNDGFLGDGSFQAGIRATELRMGKDVGTSILTGATAERFEIVKWFYLEVDDDTGYDAAADIIARAMPTCIRRSPARADAGMNRAPVAGPARRHRRPCSASTAGTRRSVPAADIPARLRTLAPDWAPYQIDQRAGHPSLPRGRARDQGARPPGTSTRSTRPRSATPSPAAAPCRRSATGRARNHDRLVYELRSE